MYVKQQHRVWMLWSIKCWNNRNCHEILVREFWTFGSYSMHVGLWDVTWFKKCDSSPPENALCCESTPLESLCVENHLLSRVLWCCESTAPESLCVANQAFSRVLWCCGYLCHVVKHSAMLSTGVCRLKTLFRNYSHVYLSRLDHTMYGFSLSFTSQSTYLYIQYSVSI